MIGPVLALALLAAGCSSTEPDVSTPTEREASATTAPPITTASPIPPVETQPSPSQSLSVVDQAKQRGPVSDDQFVVIVKAIDPGTGDLNDTEVVALAKETCSRLEAGEIYAAILLEIAQSGATESEGMILANVMVAGMLNYCPDEYGKAYPSMK